MQLPSRRFFLTIIVGSLALTALLGIVAILTSALGNVGNKVLGTTVAIDVASVLGLCCAGKAESMLHRALQLLGIIAPAFGVLIAVYIIWANVELFGNNSAYRALGAMLILGVASAHACLLLPSLGYNGLVRTLTRPTILCIAIVAELLINSVVIEGFYGGDGYYKTVEVFLILDVLGTLLIALVRRFGPPRDGVPASGASAVPTK